MCGWASELSRRRRQEEEGTRVLLLLCLRTWASMSLAKASVPHHYRLVAVCCWEEVRGEHESKEEHSHSAPTTYAHKQAHVHGTTTMVLNNKIRCNAYVKRNKVHKGEPREAKEQASANLRDFIVLEAAHGGGFYFVAELPTENACVRDHFKSICWETYWIPLHVVHTHVPKSRTTYWGNWKEVWAKITIAYNSLTVAEQSMHFLFPGKLRISFNICWWRSSSLLILATIEATREVKDKVSQPSKSETWTASRVSDGDDVLVRKTDEQTRNQTNTCRAMKYWLL